MDSTESQSNYCGEPEMSGRTSAFATGYWSEVQRRGVSFGKWFRNALERSGKSLSMLSEETHLPTGLLRIFLDDCTTTDGRTRIPDVDAVHRIAEATNAQVGDGLRILGYPVPVAFRTPPALNDLPSSTQFALARAVTSILAGHIVDLPVVSYLSAETRILNLEEIVDHYPVLRAMVAEEVRLGDLFAVHVDGYNVPEAFLRDGDWVVCRRGQDARPGDTVIVNRDGIARATVYTDQDRNRVIGIVLARTGSVR